MIFRWQPAPFRAPVPPLPGEDPLVAARRIRRSMRAGRSGSSRAPTTASAFPPAQATSPLRRYQDLVNHRQILSVLRGEPRLDAAALLEIAADCERAVHLHFFLKVQAAFHLHAIALIALSLCLLVMFSAPMAVWRLESIGLHSLVKPFAFLGYSWMDFLFLFFCIAISLDLAQLLIKGAAILFPFAPPTSW